ncbi:MAG: DNA alkylation repair protein [Velocimicrobium sp.]
MDGKEIIKELKLLSSEKYKKNVVKLGIPESNSIGVCTGDIRKLAKSISKSNELAFELWGTGYHEAKLLAVLLFDKKTLNFDDINSLMNEVYSWDLCDHICKNLIIKLKNYEQLILNWSSLDKTYFKRGMYTLIASAAIHEKNISEESIVLFLQLIRDNSFDEREHVKKAASWALREIGKRNFELQERALLLAYDLKNSNDKTQIWIGKDALKELETLVQVEERSRLISSDSKMAVVKTY